jgi:hypothetical protein
MIDLHLTLQTPVTPTPRKLHESPLPLVDFLTIATWTALGIIVTLMLIWAFRWRRSPRPVSRPWWAWLGWGLVIVASVEGSLWAVHFFGIGALDWAVPTLAGIVIPLYIFWYIQTNQRDVPVREKAALVGRGTSAPLVPVIMGEDGGKMLRNGLTVSDLRPAINFVANRLPDKDQADSIVSVSNLENVRYPTGRADAIQLWRAVFEAALDSDPESFELLLNNIRDSMGTRSRKALDQILLEIGFS